ncbi:alanine:cation symporter family protein, partial [Bacillus safensis]|uniref:alanine:cation symporter family protein n=1 Tax=Bacillus safensis TaxID=561879 RepID=UPI0028CB2914
MSIVPIIRSPSSFLQTTLPQLYKLKHKTPFPTRPPYYIQKPLNNPSVRILFPILITISFRILFNALQSNTISLAFKNS